MTLSREQLIAHLHRALGQHQSGIDRCVKLMNRPSGQTPERQRKLLRQMREHRDRHARVQQQLQALEPTPKEPHG